MQLILMPSLVCREQLFLRKQRCQQGLMEAVADYREAIGKTRGAVTGYSLCFGSRCAEGTIPLGY